MCFEFIRWHKILPFRRYLYVLLLLLLYDNFEIKHITSLYYYYYYCHGIGIWTLSKHWTVFQKGIHRKYVYNTWIGVGMKWDMFSFEKSNVIFDFGIDVDFKKIVLQRLACMFCSSFNHKEFVFYLGWVEMAMPTLY